MARESKLNESPTAPRIHGGVDLKISGEAALVRVSGLVDERFAGFGAMTGVKNLVIDVSGMTRMTSFGVRQWLKAMDALPKSISDLYLLGCPTFFVDQLNMVLNFGGAGQVLTVVAPYACPSCGVESGEVIDVLSERATLAKGIAAEKNCGRCGAKLEFDETPESYFSFLTKYSPVAVQPAAAQLLAVEGLYTTVGVSGEKPPKIVKLVHGSVTYFRIVGVISTMFRARPFLVGAEGEVVIDLAEVEQFDPLGLPEWRRLLKSLSGQVPSITLVDVTSAFLTVAGDTIGLARNISVWSVLLPYGCAECGRVTSESQTVDDMRWPFAERVCPTCGGTTRCDIRAEAIAPLKKAATSVPPASVKLIGNRQEVLSRAVADANVAQASEAAAAVLGTDDTILGKYRIVRRLSAGGMAEVFLAKQVGIGGFEKPVALKRILRQLLESRHLAVDMFLNEAKIAGRLAHPNIVQVLDVGEQAGALFLAMEYVRGKDLRDVLKVLRGSRSLMPLGDALFIIREISQALYHAYWSKDLAGQQLAVVHRDVSPHNVMLGYDGSVKLLDFGVAMSAVTEQAETMIAGKWSYMSPEHTTQQPLDHRSDLFSVGVILYLLLTGSMPFSGSDPRDIVKKIRAGSYRPLEQMAPDLPPRLIELVRRLLSPNPDDRPQTGQEVVAAITEITRSYGIEASSTSVAKLLGQLIPPEAEAIAFESSTVDDAAATQIAANSGPSRQPPPPPPSRPSPMHVPVHASATDPAALASHPTPLPASTSLRSNAQLVSLVVVLTTIIAIVVVLYLLVEPK
jgi:eukaryotic-like serine/threonine-protein kinase